MVQVRNQADRVSWSIDRYPRHFEQRLSSSSLKFDDTRRNAIRSPANPGKIGFGCKTVPPRIEVELERKKLLEVQEMFRGGERRMNVGGIFLLTAGRD